MWLAWIAWGVIGSIFLFEDSRGGSGWLSFLLTSPFWLLFAVWPFIWLWLVTRRNDEWVEIDDDVISCRKHFHTESAREVKLLSNLHSHGFSFLS